jgi:hypothetical protein
LLASSGFSLGKLAAHRARLFSPAAPAFEEMPPSVTGINWTHTNGRSPEWYLPETVGAGCGFLDYDNDGWMDIYLVNSGPCDFYTPPQPLRNALYRNNRDGTFTDVTEKAGVPGNAYGMGVAVGDYDADGFPDLYVTQYPRSILYHNNGDGTFTDVTAKAGVAAPGWGSSAVWFDYDNDGRLDLFVCRFVDFDKSKNKFCGNTLTGERWYCKPNVYGPEPSYLFHNNGDGTFTDVSRESGIAASLGKAWGVVAADINNDGWMDLFVGNDTVANFLFLNRGKKHFEEAGLLAGVGYNTFGRARSGMGVDAADYDQDGFLDLFVANVDQEMYALYHNNKDETFNDVSIPTMKIGPDHVIYAGDGSSDIHVMLHINARDGFTIAVSETKHVSHIAQRTILSSSALGVLVPILEKIVGKGRAQIRTFLESYGFLIQEWDKVRTDWLTLRPATEEPVETRAGDGLSQ